MSSHRRSLQRISRQPIVVKLIRLLVLGLFFYGGLHVSLAQEAGMVARPLPILSQYGMDGERKMGADGQDARFTQFASWETAVSEPTLSVIVTYDSTITPTAIETAVDGQQIHQFTELPAASFIMAGAHLPTLADLPGITGIYLDKPHQQASYPLAPTGIPSGWHSLGNSTLPGQGMRLGLVGGGITPERLPFAATERTAVLPCHFGSSSDAVTDAPFTCNNKLIGAYQILDTYKALGQLSVTDVDSARAHDSHSDDRAIAAVGLGTAQPSGIAPNAQLVIYKACGVNGCYTSDLMAAVEQAIADGVTVIDWGVYGNGDEHDRILAQSLLRAYGHQIFVAQETAPETAVSDDSYTPWGTPIHLVTDGAIMPRIGELVHTNSTESVSQPPASITLDDNTPMATPHLAGLALLLRQIHPTWSAGQIQSALISGSSVHSTTFDLHKAANPGVTISETADGYISLGDALWNSNSPTLFIPAMPGELTVARTFRSTLSYSSWWEITIEAPEDVEIRTRGAIGLPAGGEKSLSMVIDARMVPPGETRQAAVLLQEIGGSHSARLPIQIVRETNELEIHHHCAPDSFLQFESTQCSLSITNNNPTDVYINVHSTTPRRLRLLKEIVTGATAENWHTFTYSGILSGATPHHIQMDDITSSSSGLLPLSSLGISPLGGVTDDSIINFTIPEFKIGEQSYTTVGMVSNGYLVVGGGSSSNAGFVNQRFPDPQPPNNVLAPFWTDLNPESGGNLYAGILANPTTGQSWAVFEWNQVPNYSDGLLNTFQVWVGLNGTEDVRYMYGADISTGDMGLLTVGAENADGTVGVNWTINGEGTAVLPGQVFRVTTVPGSVGSSHRIDFGLTGWAAGEWDHCVEINSGTAIGTQVSCFSGEIMPTDANERPHGP